MPGRNIAGVFEVVALAVPASPALIQGDRIVSRRELDRRADLSRIRASLEVLGG